MIKRLTQLFLVLGLASIGANSFAQTIQSSGAGTGAWNDALSWTPNTVPTFANSTLIQINSGHTITVTAPVTIDQTSILSGGTIIVNSGVTLSLNNGSGNEITVNASGNLTVNGTISPLGGFPAKTILVNGNLNNNGALTGAAISNLTFGSGSNYFHLFTDGGVIPKANWNANSTMNITGLGVGALTLPSNLQQTFGNFIWNTPQFNGFFDLAGQPSIINGDFRIDDTGSIGNGAVVYNFGSGANTTFTVGGDFINNGGQFAFTSTVGPGTLNINNSLTAGKGLKITGGVSQIADDINVTVNCQGLVSIANGSLELGGSTATTTFNVSGDFTYSSGSLLSSSGTSTLNFSGTSLQTFSNNAVNDPVGNLNYNVPLNAILSIPGNNFISGGGTLTVSGTLNVGSTNTSGAMQTGSSAGNIRVSGTRTYNSASTVIYNGVGAQYIGNGHPATVGVNTTINNTSGLGVSLIVGTPVIITTNLTLLQGNLNIGDGSLTLNGSLTAGANNITITSGGSIIINGSSSIGTFPFPSGAQTFTGFTLNNSNGVNFNNNDITITGVVTLTTGSLSFVGRLLTLNGTFAGTGSGDLSPSSTSTFVINGSGAFGTPRINSTNNTVGTFTFNRSTSGTATIGSTLIVNTTANLTNGNLTNTGGFQMANGSTLIRNSNAQLLGSAPTNLATAQFYNVTYSGSSMTTGLELSNTADDMLGQLTINGGTITLNKNIIVHSGVDLQSSTLDASGFNITMVASPGTWNKGSGSFIGGTGVVTIAGSTTITASSTPSFTNIITNIGSTLTFPSGNINISGDLNINSGSTFNKNGGTIIFNGSGNQTITGGSKSFNNVAVNKSGGFVDILPSFNLIGNLDIQTATQVKANGNLTLISTSDGASGNAAITKIASGASVTGNVMTQRYMSAKGAIYRDISSPVSSATVFQIMSSGISVTGFAGSSYPCTGCTNNTRPSMFYYDETVPGAITLGQVGITSSAQVLGVGSGYNLFVRTAVGAATISLTGVINSGSIALPVSFTNSSNAADGWSFVGNPYPCTIDWNASLGWTKSNIQGNMISVWDAGAGAYKTWNGTTGSLGNGRIAQGQGFWVQASASPSLNITEDAKIGTTGAFYRQKSQPIHTVELILSGALVEDRTYIQQVDGSSLAFDNMDGTKLTIDNFSLSSMTQDNRSVAINAVGDVIRSGKMALMIANVEKGNYTFTSNSIGDFVGIKVSIFDKTTNVLQDLSDPKGYSFSVTDNENSKRGDRFVLVFGNEKGGNNALDEISFYPNPVSKTAMVHINTDQLPQGDVIDIMGKSVGIISWEKEADSISWNGALDMQAQSAGIYFARIRLNEGVRVIKFLKN